MDEGADAALWYDGHYYTGKPAVVRHGFDAGRCYYVGTVLDDAGLAQLLRCVLDEVDVPVIPDLPASVETTCRVRDGQRTRFYLNHAAEPVELGTLSAGMELLTGQPVGDRVTLPAFGVVIVQEVA